MTWPAEALFSIEELKRVAVLTGAGSDPLLAEIARWVVSDIEGHLGRRIVYRAPTEDDDAIYTGTFTAGSPAVGGQPAAPGKTLVVSFPDGSVGGTLTVTGTVAGVTTSRVFDVADGPTQRGLDFWTAISGLTIAGANPASGTLKVGTAAGYVEYHSPNQTAQPGELWLMDWPVYQVAAIYEDASRVYATALASTEYLVADRSRLVRLASGGLSSWAWGYRAVKGVYSAGYFGAANVPGRIKRSALRLAAMYYQESTKGQIEIASGSNAMGNWSRTGPATLTREMRADLTSERLRGNATGERDFDTVAA